MSKRRSSYTAEFKLKVIKFAEENGNRSAARNYEIDEKSVRQWRQKKNVLTVMPSRKRALRTKSASFPELEDELKKWVLSIRENKRRVTTIDIRFKAIQLAKDKGFEFKASNSWCFKFMKRNSLSVRCVTSVGQPLPSDWREKVELFKNYVRKQLEGVDLDQFGNMDEVPVSFDMPGTRTVDETGKEDIILTTTGCEKLCFTVVLCCTADGSKCPPMVIFKRKTMPKENFPNGLIVKVNPKGWMNESMMNGWLELVWRRRKGSFFKKNSLLVYDSQRAHITTEIKQTVSKYSRLAVIPGGLTKILQPLDLSVNKSFKSTIRSEWEKWMIECIHTFTKSGRMRRASYLDICNMVLKSWEKVKPECVRNGFIKAELISNESNIQTSSITSDSESTDEELDENLIQYRNIIEALNIISDDEEFDGF